MIESWTRMMGLLALGWGLAHPAVASGQMTPVPATPLGAGAMPPAAMLANPYLNPYLNPYINPAATQRPISAGDAALYLYSANAARGGIGSGRLSQVRPAAPRAKPAEMPDGASVPGAGAARFFNPGPVNVNGAGRYFNSRRGYFQNNGR